MDLSKSCIFLCVVLVSLLIQEEGVQGGGVNKRRKELPINDHMPRLSHSKSKASECRFGGNSYELEETWHPDLGAPFNTMYCVHCECVPFHKKRRIVGRVRCKNIKTECPKPTCDDPVLLPNRCCKVCPGQELTNPDLNITVDLKREEEEKNGRHYVAVLTGPHMGGRAATGRFYFRKKTLQYSFLLGQSLGWPTHLTFLNKRDNDILEEFGLTLTPLQNKTQKLCGSWARLPRKYRRTLKSEDMAVSLTTPLGTITGKVVKCYGLTSEMFSGLLEGKAGAGTIVVSVSPASGSVHANLLFNGIVKEGEVNIPFLVRFQMTRGLETRIVEETVILKSTGMITDQDMSSIEIKTFFDVPELEALGQGQLLVSVMPTGHPDRELKAILVPRLSCDIFDCVLRPGAGESGHSDGIAFMYFTRDGGLQYNIRIDTAEEVTDIRIDNNKQSKRLLTIITGIMSNYANGWANGTALLTANQVEDLFKENLYLNIETVTKQQAMRGRLVTHLAGPAEASGEAVILSGANSQAGTGLAWVSLDDTCRLHYNVRLEGKNLENSGQHLELEDYPMNRDSKTSPLFPGTKTTLQECRGKKCSGHRDNVHKLTMARLDSGDAAFLMTSLDPSIPLSIKGKLMATSSPRMCLPRYARNDLEHVPGYLSDLGEEIGDEDLAAEMRQKCAYEGIFYDDGQRWGATHAECKMCSCQRGKVNCEPIICPPTNCTDPIIPEGECCPTCRHTISNGRSCNLGTLHHPAGSRWHPYMPPFGFSRCAVCTCEDTTLTVECHKEQCPDLDCAPSEAVRPGPLACCKTCPAKVAEVVKSGIVNHEFGELSDMGRVRTGLDVLAEGGCSWKKGQYRENGATWHPTVMPWGEMRCVLCACKDGKSGCKKRRCPVLTCQLKTRDQNACCPRCAKGHHEEQSARRKIQQTSLEQRRQKRLRRLRRLRSQRSQGAG